VSKCGTAKEHCCWFKGVVCQYLTQADQPSKFTWACSLRAKANSWAEVHASADYLANVKPKFADAGLDGMDCGNWPYAGGKCNDCGEVGNG